MKQLILRTVHPSGKSRNGFVWPLTVGATASAPDWSPSPSCGNGLHGWLFGCGNPDVAEFYDTYLWLVLEVEELVDLKGKVKFPSAVVQFVGSRKEAIDYMVERTPAANLLTINWREAGAAGDESTLTAGRYSTLTAGDKSTIKAGANSNIIIHYHDGPKTYHVGTDLLPDTAYIFKNGSYELA